jgi:hypothetical protein
VPDSSVDSNPSDAHPIDSASDITSDAATDNTNDSSPPQSSDQIPPPKDDSKGMYACDCSIPGPSGSGDLRWLLALGPLFALGRRKTSRTSND